VAVNPAVLPMLRMATCPPIARDRLIGLAGVSPNLVKNMEDEQRVSPAMKQSELMEQLGKIGNIIERMADPDIFVWKQHGTLGTAAEVQNASSGDFPILIEAKSAGDFTNTNKRRKEEAVKIQQLRKTYGDKITFDLFLCGYFDSGYLGYEAAEGIDWVWEHRIDDLAQFGL
jgi:hypothetical protein